MCMDDVDAGGSMSWLLSPMGQATAISSLNTAVDQAIIQMQTAFGEIDALNNFQYLK